MPHPSSGKHHFGATRAHSRIRLFVRIPFRFPGNKFHARQYPSIVNFNQSKSLDVESLDAQKPLSLIDCTNRNNAIGLPAELSLFVSCSFCMLNRTTLGNTGKYPQARPRDWTMERRITTSHAGHAKTRHIIETSMPGLNECSHPHLYCDYVSQSLHYDSVCGPASRSRGLAHYHQSQESNSMAPSHFARSRKSYI
jgi:hypothetical protein